MEQIHEEEFWLEIKTIKNDVDVAASIQESLQQTGNDNIIGSLAGAYDNQEGRQRNLNAAPEIAGIASGVDIPTIQRASETRKIPLTEKTIYTKRLKLSSSDITELEEQYTQPGLYVIVCTPKLQSKPSNYPSDLPPGCITMISSKEDCPFGFAKIGIWMKDGHSRLKTICDSHFPESMYDIEIKMIRLIPQAASWEDMG